MPYSGRNFWAAALLALAFVFVSQSAARAATTVSAYPAGVTPAGYVDALNANANDAPDASFDGYNFWLSKLNEFNGDYIAAEMVKAFINSAEYRRRFGQP